MVKPSNIAQLPSQATASDPQDDTSSGTSRPVIVEVEDAMDKQVFSMVAHATKSPDYSYERKEIGALAAAGLHEGELELQNRLRLFLKRVGHLLKEDRPDNKEISYDK